MAKITTAPDAQERGDRPNVTERWRRASGALFHDQHEYWLNSAYLRGEQWLWWNPSAQQLATLPRDSGPDGDRVRVTINKIWPAMRSTIARLTSKPLIFENPPSAADDSTVKAARLGESILTSAADDHDWEGLREDHLWAMYKGATAAICIEWDPTAGTPLGQTSAGTKIGTGETVETVLPITDFAVEPGARDAEHARWWIKRVALPPEEVQAQFKLEDLPAADAASALTPFQRNMVSNDATGANIQLTNVFTYYERPNDRAPQGWCITVVNDMVLKAGPWPFPFKERLNLVVGRETRIENQWTGETILTAARPIQNGINQSWSSIIEHMKLAGNARLAMPDSMRDQAATLTDTPGETLFVPSEQGGMKPDYVSPPQMPNWWIEEPDRLKRELDDTLSQHDTSRGAAPANIESGLGLSILVEQDNTPLGRITKESAGCFSRLARMMLQIYEKKVTGKRTAIVRAPGQPPETNEWVGSDLHGQTNARVPADAIMPSSKAAKMAYAEKLVEMGLIQPGPAGLVQFLHIADVPDRRDVIDYVEPDVSKARRENAAMWTGEIRTPEKFDDHHKHTLEHLSSMKGPMWDYADDQVKETFLLHLQAHATLSAEVMGEALAKANTSPMLAAAANPWGGPTVPPGQIPMGPGAPGPAGLPVVPGTPAPGVADAVQAQNPDVSPAVIGPAVGPGA